MRLGLFFRCSRCEHVSRNRPRDGWTHVMISTGSKTDHYMYRHLVVDYTSPVKIVIINEVSTVAFESESIISSEITPVIKEFSIVSPVTAAAILAAPFSFVLPLLLCFPVGEHVGNRYFKLSTAEFAYDTSVGPEAFHSSFDDD